MILLWLVGQLLLRCQGIALRVEPANDCLDAVPGDSCHKLVKWALDQGLEKHPEWFPSFKRSYSEELDFKHIQGILHSHKKAGCGRPCLAEPDAASPPAAGEAAPAAPAAGEATPEATLEAALAAAFEKAAPADAPEPAAREERPPRSNLIGKLEGELEALGAMMDSPDLETLRTEKRQLIQNLRAADKLEAELKAHKLQNQQAVKKIEGELERLEGMENSPAMELLRGEKSKEIDEVRAADKSETELKTREIQRLQDPAAAAKEVAATDAPAAAAPAAAAAAKEVLKPEDRTNLLGKLDAELKAMDHMKDSPAMETLRAEKRQLIQNLQAANKLEAELKAGQLQNQKTVAKMEADLKALEEMNDSPALQALRTEKRTQIQNLQEADKTEAERTVRELRRLQDPAEAAKDAAPAAPAAERAKPEAPAAGRKPWWKKWQKAKAKEEATTEEATAVVDSQSEATPEQATAPAASSREAEPAEAPAAAAGEADPEVALAPSAAEEATPLAAPAAEEAKPADASTPAKALAAAAGEEDPEVALAPPAAEEATPDAAPAAEEAKPADAATPAKAPAQAAEGAAPSNLILPQRAAGDLGGCMDAVAGDRCHVMVKWALEKGVAKHPDMFQSYRQSSSEEVNFKRIQEILHNREKGGCGMPCWNKKEPPSAARMQAQDCKDPVDGDKCHKFVTWALAKGPKALPDLFSNFTFSFSDEANFKQMQGILHDAGKANCTKPCPVVYTPAEEARLKREADEAQGCLDAVDGDRCHKIVTWALTKGIAVMPEYFSNFTRSESEDSDFKRMQGFLHDDGKGGCRKPCSDPVAELGVPVQREAGVTTTNFVMPVFDMPAMPAVDAEMAAAAATSTLPALAPQEESPSDEQEEMPSADAEPTREAPVGEPAAQNAAAQNEAEVKDPQSSAAAEAPAEEQATAAPAAEDEAEGKPAVAEGRPAATEAKEPERKPRSRMERAVAWQEEAEATAAARQPAKLAKLDASGEECVDAVPGDRCHETVKWTLAEGLEANPELFPSFHRSSSEEYDFKHIQAILHMRGAAGCGKPCDMVQAPTGGLEATGAEVQGATESEAQLWTYTPVNGKAITARGEPEFDGKKTGKKLSPGDTFRVVEEKKVGETTFLKLADGEGWLFDMKPEVGIMCTKVQSAAEAVDQEKEEENNENKTALEPMTSKSLSEMSPEEFQTYLGDQSELDKYAYYLSHTSRRKRWEDEAKRQNKTQSLASRRQKV